MRKHSPEVLIITMGECEDYLLVRDRVAATTTATPAATAVSCSFRGPQALLL